MLGRRTTSATDREAPTQNLEHSNEVTRDTATIDLEFENGRGDGVANSSIDDHDSGIATGDSVMLISRTGQDFSLRGSVISMRVGAGRSPIEADRRSIEVVPPTPKFDKQPFRGGAYHTRSASTPHFHSTPDTPLLRSFSPSIADLSTSNVQIPPRLPWLAPTPLSTQRAASGSSPSSREEALGIHYYTSATPPPDPAGPVAGTAAPLSLSSRTPSDQRARHAEAGYSPPVAPFLQNYAPSFPGRFSPSSPYVPPSSVPSSPIRASDPRNLIPSAVRGAGYNPFQHSRSASDLK
ncbi:hypothetical protein B0F90DRAFT_1666372 [Multifurca ochricompacta]|uniref:Uncharacterized protein n=1 Tax=Multifurca ochricompacta TaxID=376703 RepID=A0AAD4M804_9AGAM|nr:hypothetical protein B0F90DRAFT_1666372 [Multifurca ochricompacta]